MEKRMVLIVLVQYILECVPTQKLNNLELDWTFQNVSILFSSKYS